MLGNVHSIETCGAVDGPGLRMVVFLQGCPMRCRFCHNPDTWAFDGGTAMAAEAVLARFERNRAFYRNGGITLSGGEPLAQPEFVAGLFSAAHRAPRGRIHTCLDTSGIAFDPARPEKTAALLAETDLVLLDIKHPDPEGHRWLTGRDQDRPLAFADELAHRGVPMVIRHVVVPGVTDNREAMEALGRLVAHWSNVAGLELLPYHTMGVHKYVELGIPYPLEGVPPLDPARLPELYAWTGANESKPDGW